MGTQIQAANLVALDFDGLDGCNEILNLTKPDLVADIHRRYLNAGADIVETNTFGAMPWVLDDYQIGDKTAEICYEAARIASAVATDRDAFVFGALGPGTKLVTLGNISFDEMEAGYFLAYKALIEGGADALLAETCQDLLQTKAVVVAMHRALVATGKDLPIFIQITMEQTGTMLLGSEIGAALNFLEFFPKVSGIGINCATGPEEMLTHIRFLSNHCTRFISVQPNAGLPVMENGQGVYKLTPDSFADFHYKFVTEFGASLVGGCCGTTPQHIAAVHARLRGAQSKKRIPNPLVGCSSLYQFQPYDQTPSFLIIGERTNANGSRAFKDALAAGDNDSLISIAREQEAEGSHVLDVCTAFVGRNEVQDMTSLLSDYAKQITIPIMIDSTELPVIHESLKVVPGKPLINSINFEDGGKRLHEVLFLCKQYGAGVVALTIDEDGMAKTSKKKVEIAERILDSTRSYGIADEDVFIDTLTFTLGSGDEEFRRAGIETLNAIRNLKARHPKVNTILGISNISFGLKQASRHVINSVFLQHAREAGLTSAIVHAGKILPSNRVEPEAWEIARKLVFDERKDEFDPLVALMAKFEKLTIKTEQKDLDELPVEERLKRHIIDGLKKNLTLSLDEALKKYEPIEIINDILLDGMKVVGELFGSGKMQLPFVLQSAEVMKAAVAYLEPLMAKEEGTEKGSILLATVAGDVHDIGKNLVDIILSNNGYRVVNIGIKQPISNILAEAEKHKVQAIGMSGLLVKSTVIMRENLIEMNERGLENIPVILGGAALTRSYVEDDLRREFKGAVAYAKDAFEGLSLMEDINSGKFAEYLVPKDSQRVSSHRLPQSNPELYEFDGTKSDISPATNIPNPPFIGSKVADDISVKDVFQYINETALFRGQWGFKRPDGITNPEFSKYLEDNARPHFERLKSETASLFDPKVVYGYYYANSDGNDLIVSDTSKEVARFRFPRQSEGRRLCLSDFFAPIESNVKDVVAFHLVTIGNNVTMHERSLFEAGDFQEYLFMHGLGVETAEALAEYFHRHIRFEWGIADQEPPDIKGLFGVKYRGCRYSFGYPACPNLEDQAILFQLLNPERIDVTLTEEFMLSPEQSTSALIVHHKDAKYFNIR